MHSSIFLLSLPAVALALSGHAHPAHAPRGLHYHHHRRSPPTPPFDLAARNMRAKRMRTLFRRKTPGENDVTSVPSNLASGSWDGSDSSKPCKVWHTVVDGEVCDGLIDKSSSNFTLDVFYDANPSLAGDCGNLQVGLAYCVDTTTAAGTGPGSTSPATTAPVKAIALAASPTTSAPTTTQSDDCEDESTATASSDDDDCNDEPASDDDGEDCDDGDSTDSSSSSTSPTTTSRASPTTTPADTVAVQVKVKPTSTSGGNSGSGGIGISGAQATWFLQNGNAGACGTVHQDSDMVVALYTSLYNGGSLCGKTVTLTNKSNGKSVQAMVADECPSCNAEPQGIDCSQGLFEALSGNDLGLGVLDVDYTIN